MTDASCASFPIWFKSGFQKVIRYYFVSNIGDHDLKIISEICRSADMDMNAYLLDVGEPRSLRFKSLNDYIYKDGFCLSLSEVSKQLSGRYLLLEFPYRESDHHLHDQTRMKFCCAAQLYLGREAALKLAVVASSELPECRSWSYWAPEGVGVSDYYEQSESWCYQAVRQSLGDNFCGFDFKTLAARLFNSAMLQADLNLRFALMWMAFEAQVGDGKNRRKFCIDEMQSPELNALINSIRKIRDDLFHAELNAETVKRHHVELLHVALFLAAITDSLSRQKLLPFVLDAAAKAFQFPHELPLVKHRTSVALNLGALTTPPDP